MNSWIMTRKSTFIVGSVTATLIVNVIWILTLTTLPIINPVISNALAVQDVLLAFLVYCTMRRVEIALGVSLD